MSSETSHTAPPEATPETGSSRRLLVRRIAICAAVGAIVLVSGAAGWFLQSALHSGPTDVVESEPHVEADAAAGDDTHDDPPLDGTAPAAADQASTEPHVAGAESHHTGEETAPPDVNGHAAADGGEQSSESTSGASVAGRTAPAAAIPTPDELARAEAVGEQHLMVGAAADALREFDWVMQFQDRSLDDRLHYRCGICAESLGKFDRALTEYGTALSSAHDETLIVLCRLGQARVWRALGHLEMGTQLLATAWLTSAESELAPIVRPFIAYLFADALLTENLAADPPQLTEDDGCLFPVWEFDLFERTLLTSLRTVDSRHPAVVSGVRVLPQSGDGAADVTVQARLPRMGLHNIVDALCREAALRTVWSDGARQAVEGRSAEICLARGSLPLCLDALTLPLGIVWVQADGEVRLSAADEADAETITAARRRAARLALEYAVQQHPEFVLGPHALVALGNIAQQDGRIDEAERLYIQMLERFPRSAIRSDAWFNRAKLELKRDHTDAAMNAFWYVIDSGGAPATASVAYLYIGRLLLDAEQPRRAITPLIRATQWTPDSAVRTKSVLCLAAAYLLYGNPDEANKVLMDFRGDVESEALQGAFLSALARYRAADNPTRRLDEGQALLSAIDPVNPAEFFGRFGWYLCGRTYEELLLPEIAAGVYREALEVHERVPYYDAVVYGLGTCLADIGESDAAQVRLIELMQHAAPDWQRRAAFRLCRLQLDSDQALAASQTARTLVDQCTDQGDKARALQLLGAAHQQLGDHAAAALCFAGTVPGTSPPAETEEH